MTLNEKVTKILEDSDFNILPYVERVRISKYMSQQ